MLDTEYFSGREVHSSVKYFEGKRRRKCSELQNAQQEKYTQCVKFNRNIRCSEEESRNEKHI